MNHHPYRNEMVRLLLHCFGAIKVPPFFVALNRGNHVNMGQYYSRVDSLSGRQQEVVYERVLSVIG